MGKMRKIKTWSSGKRCPYGLNVKMELFDIGIHSPRTRLAYRFYWNGKLLFKGNDYQPSPLDAIDSKGSIVGLLGFLACQLGDVDDDYFKGYNAEQMEWAESYDCEKLGLLVLDYEEGITNALD